MLHWEDDLLPDVRIQKNNVRYHFLQYTGLKDKNGKEIYEGDLVKIDNNYHDHNCSQVAGSYDNDRYSIEEVDMFNLRMNHTNWGCEIESGHLEIIGNIHENPELLKT